MKVLVFSSSKSYLGLFYLRKKKSLIPSAKCEQIILPQTTGNSRNTYYIRHRAVSCHLHMLLHFCLILLCFSSFLAPLPLIFSLFFLSVFPSFFWKQTFLRNTLLVFFVFLRNSTSWFWWKSHDISHLSSVP